MSIITISRGSYTRGKEIAEKVSQELGYECIAREALLEASKQFNVPEIKLIHAIQNAPSFIDYFSYGKEKYIAYIQTALLRHVQKDNVVYHGFAGHFLIKGVSHVLKVRIVADMESRTAIVMERDRVSREEAIHFLKIIDEQRRKWSQSLYGIDTREPSLYDIVLNINKLTVDDAVEIICDTVNQPKFQTTQESQNAMDDLLLACEVKAALIGVKPDIEVSASDGVVLMQTTGPLYQEKSIATELRRMGQQVEGVKDVRVKVVSGFQID
jgi:cytidylate kinase